MSRAKIINGRSVKFGRTQNTIHFFKIQIWIFFFHGSIRPDDKIVLLFLCKTVNKMCVCIRVAMNVLNFKQVFGIRHVPESYPADIHVKLESLT